MRSLRLSVTLCPQVKGMVVVKPGLGSRVMIPEACVKVRAPGRTGLVYARQWITRQLCAEAASTLISALTS